VPERSADKRARLTNDLYILQEAPEKVKTVGKMTQTEVKTVVVYKDTDKKITELERDDCLDGEAHTYVFSSWFSHPALGEQ